MSDMTRPPTGENPAASALPQRSAEDEDLTPLGRALTTAEARHFLSRTSFGSTELAVAELTTLGLERYVDRMLDVDRFPGVATVELEAQALKQPDHPEVEREGAVWTYVIVRTPNPFQEVMALFWNGHFGATFDTTEIGSRDFATEYLRLLRTTATGNFKELVAQVAASSLMLQFLNGFGSTKEAPNENFAREQWELFTLGRDNGYTQADIFQAARALTGFTRRFEAEIDSRVLVEYDPARHDSGDKQIFGRTLEGRDGADGALEYRDLLELTFSARDPGPWIARRLWEYFVYLNPSEKLIATLGQQLRAHDWDVAALLRTVFLSKAFFSPAANVGLVKSPVEYVVGFLRATGLQLKIDGLTNMLAEMGQMPGYPPGVNGWPSGKLWLSSSQVVQRANMVNAAIAGMPPDGLDLLLPPATQRSKAEVVTALTNHLNLPLEPEERRLYEESLDIGPEENDSSTRPFDGRDPKIVRERVANLLYTLAQHPGYHLR